MLRPILTTLVGSNSHAAWPPGGSGVELDGRFAAPFVAVVWAHWPVAFG